MAAIYENLKRVRKERSITQEEVAQKLGVTRQTISSYESGRTSPDIETLKRLAEIYNVSFDDVLYGDSGTQRGRRSLKIAAIILLICLFLSCLVPSMMLWYANRYLFVQPGPVTDAVRPMLELRLTLSDLRETIQAVGMNLSGLCALVTFILTLIQESRVALSRKLQYFGILLLAAAAATLPWALSDAHFGAVNYLIEPGLQLCKMALLLLLSFPGERFVAWLRCRQR